MEINPLYYELPARIQLVNLGKNRIGISKVIKSRIIRKDAAKIVAMASQIKEVNPELEVSLICSRNICSKSLISLKNEGIEIEYID